MIPQATDQRIPETRSPERRGRSVIEEAKAKVATIDLADRLLAETGGRWRKVGDEWATNCVLPSHADRSPSFTVNPDKNLWFCHGCIRGGDVVTLAQQVWDIDRPDVAAAEVLLTFGHPIPNRPPAWFARQERQTPVRAAIEQTRKAIYRRRLFKYLILPALQRIEDEEEYNRELDRAWRDFEEMLP